MPQAKPLIRSLLAMGDEGYSFLVVPGGGPMADLVREIYSRGDLSDEAAHWMAVLAMEQYAHFLADGTGASLTSDIRRPCPEVEPALLVLLPYQALRRDDRGLEHNWDYTSDSVATLIAAQLKAPLIKATDVDGVIIDCVVASKLSASRLLGRESCIDQGTISLLSGPLRKMKVWVLNGTDERRFTDALKKGEGGTVIIG